MANEAIIKKSAYTEIISSAAIATTTFSATSTSIQSEGTISTNEKLYTHLDFKLKHTATAPSAAGEKIELYRQPSDGTNTAATPGNIGQGTAGALLVGKFLVDDVTAQTCYLYGVENIDPNDLFWLYNADTNSFTCSLEVRTRTIGPAA